MIPTDLSSLANHLWQSTFFCVAAWLLALAVRKNRAAVRYRNWMAASLKFLIPFSAMVSLGSRLGWRSTPVSAPPQFTAVMNEVSRHFCPVDQCPGPDSAAVVEPPYDPAILVAVWLCGITLGLIFWVRTLWQLRTLVRGATPLDLNLPIPVMSSCIAPGAGHLRHPQTCPAAARRHNEPPDTRTAGSCHCSRTVPPAAKRQSNCGHSHGGRNPFLVSPSRVVDPNATRGGTGERLRRRSDRNSRRSASLC